MKVLSARTRIRLLEMLEDRGDRGATVDQLHTLDLGTLANVSNHLRLMRQARLVRCAKEERHVRYWLEDYTWRRPVDIAAESVEASVEEMRSVFDPDSDVPPA